MSKIGLVVLLSFLSGRTLSQDYFVFIGSDHRQPFYVRLDSQLYNSSPEGHLLLAPLRDSDYTMTIGFPGETAPEQRYALRVRGKDRAFELRRQDDGSWRLYDEGAKNWVTAQEKEKGSGEDGSAGVKKDDAFSRMMAGIVHDTAVLYNTFAMEEALKDSPTGKSTPAPDSAVALRADSSVAGRTGNPVAGRTGNPVAGRTDKPIAGRADSVVAMRVNRPKVVLVDSAAVRLVDSPEVARADSAVVNRAGSPAGLRADSVVVNRDPAALRADSFPIPRVDSPAKRKPDNSLVRRGDNLVKRKADSLHKGAAVAAIPVAPSAAQAVVKVSEKQSSHSVRQVYTDNKDTVVVIIPRDTAAAAAVAKPVDTAGRAGKTIAYINSDCHNFATDYDVDRLRVKMLAAAKDEDRIGLARKIFKTKCFYTPQVRALSEVFSSDAGKYRFFEAAWPFAADEHFPELSALLSDPVYIGKFKTLTGARP